MASDVWAARVKSFVARDQSQLRQLEHQLGQARTRLHELESMIGALLEDMRKQAVAREDRMRDLELMKDDPVVLVRTYGSPSTYHSAAAPCGWVQNSGNFEALLRSEAEGRQLRPC